MSSLPDPQRHAAAFITGGAYAMLIFLGALEGLIGGFHYNHSVGSFPLAAVGLAALVLLTCLLGAAGMGSIGGALGPAIGWFLVSLVLTMPTSGGSVIIAGTAAGEWYLYGGAVCAGAAVILAFVLRTRAAVRPRPAHARHNGARPTQDAGP